VPEGLKIAVRHQRLQKTTPPAACDGCQGRKEVRTATYFFLVAFLAVFFFAVFLVAFFLAAIFLSIVLMVRQII
jgi:hypothetical protein